MKRFLIFVLMAWGCWSSLSSAIHPLSFQGQLHLKRVVTFPIRVPLRIDLYENETNALRYSEKHEVSLGRDGVFNVKLGAGIALDGLFSDLLFREKLRVEVFVDVDGRGWEPGGKSSIYMLPYALGASAVDEPEAVSSDLVIPAGLSILSGADTMIRLTPAGRLGTGFYKDPWLGWSAGKNQRMYFYGTEDLPEKAALLSFHWTILSSKPAVVTYDENFVRHYAVVAHYWSNSGRVHQHISMEVDDASGAVQTRFEFPWGRPRVDVETHSANFRVDGGGSLYVGENEDVPDSVYALVYKDLHVGGLAQIGSTSGQTDADVLFRLVSPQREASLRLWQGQGTADVVLNLVRGEQQWALTAANTLLVKHNSTTVLSMDRNGRVGFPALDPMNSTLSVGGQIVAEDGFRSSGQAVVEFRLPESPWTDGDLVGINPANGKCRLWQTGDYFYGIGSPSNTAAICLKGGVANALPVAVLGPVPVKAAQIKIEKGRVYTLDGTYIGLSQANNYVILKSNKNENK